MKITEILQIANKLVKANLDEGLFYKTQMDDQLFCELSTNDNLMALLNCVNITLNTIAFDYLPLTTEEKITVFGVLPYNSFAKQVYKINSAMKSNGLRVHYRYRPNGVLFDDSGELTINYNYRPNKVNLLDEGEVGSSQISAQTVAFGVASEFCLINAMYEEAAIWDKRFKDELNVITSSKIGIVMPKRVWS